jgi:hypothetical protein
VEAFKSEKPKATTATANVSKIVDFVIKKREDPIVTPSADTVQMLANPCILPQKTITKETALRRCYVPLNYTAFPKKPQKLTKARRPLLDVHALTDLIATIDPKRVDTAYQTRVCVCGGESCQQHDHAR